VLLLFLIFRTESSSCSSVRKEISSKATSSKMTQQALTSDGASPPPDGKNGPPPQHQPKNPQVEALKLLKGTDKLKQGLAEMLKGGVIMDVMNVEQAKIAEKAGACAVMALERIPADIRKDSGVARASDYATETCPCHRIASIFADSLGLSLSLPLSLERERSASGLSIGSPQYNQASDRKKATP